MTATRSVRPMILDCAAFLPVLLTSLLQVPTYAQVDQRRIDVSVDRGRSDVQNVGAGFQLVTQKDTELHIHLYSTEGRIVKSDMMSWAPDTKWSKVDGSETHWRGIWAGGTADEGIDPNHQLWCVIRCTMEYDGEGEGPVYRWMSVSDVDLDADTDNDNFATRHRAPSRSQTEDYHEYPGVLSSHVIGLIVPINDNNDVAWHIRDGTPSMDPEHDPDVLDFVLEINPKKAGKWTTTFADIYRYTTNGVSEAATDRHLAKDQHEVLDLRLESAWNAVSGQGATGYGFFALNEPSAGYVPRDAIRYLFLGCDIDVDTDNNGVLAPSNSLFEGEDFLEAHPAEDNLYQLHPEFKHGLIVWPNDNDDNNDDFQDNGFVEWDIWSNDNAFEVQEGDDLANLGQGALRGLGVYAPDEQVIYSELAPVLRLFKVSGDGAVRVFMRELVDDEWNYTRMGEFIDDGEDIAVAGFGNPAVENWKRLRSTGADIRIEGLRSGEVVLAHDLLLRGKPVHRDEVRITVAPIILLPNTQPAEEVYVSGADPSFVQALKTALGDEGNEDDRLVVVPYGTEEGEYDDVWLQDQVELGYYQRPAYQQQPASVTRHVALEMPRGGDLRKWVRSQFLNTDCGLSAGPSSRGVTARPDWGGNVEVTPPVTVGGTHYKLGRIVVGSSMHEDLKEFFERQKVQAPLIELDVDWLYMGHVDEVISFVPDGSGGFNVLIADTNCAFDLLRDLNREDTGTATAGGATTLTDAIKNWNAHDGGEWRDGFVEITAGTGAGQVRQIESNSGTIVTVKTAWGTVPAPDSEYQLVARSAYRNMFVEGDEDLGVAESATATTLVDGTKNWPAGVWVDGYVGISDGTGRGQIRRVTASTGTQLTVAPPWDAGHAPDGTSRYSVALGSKYWDSGPAQRPVRYFLSLSSVLSYNAACQSKLGLIRQTLAQSLQLDDYRFIRIPAIFVPYGATDRARARMPNMVNSLVDGSTLVMARPFGPRNASGDVFEIDIASKLPNMTVVPLDSWDRYHRCLGNIHCGTNAMRTPPDVKWWE